MRRGPWYLFLHSDHLVTSAYLCHIAYEPLLCGKSSSGIVNGVFIKGIKAKFITLGRFDLEQARVLENEFHTFLER